MHIYEATHTLSQSQNQLQKNNIQFLAYDKCSNFHLLEFFEIGELLKMVGLFW